MVGGEGGGLVVGHRVWWGEGEESRMEGDPRPRSSWRDHKGKIVAPLTVDGGGRGGGGNQSIKGHRPVTTVGVLVPTDSSALRTSGLANTFSRKAAVLVLSLCPSMRYSSISVFAAFSNSALCSGFPRNKYNITIDAMNRCLAFSRCKIHPNTATLQM